MNLLPPVRLLSPALVIGGLMFSTPNTPLLPGPGTSLGADKPADTMVQPEFLPQGYIIVVEDAAKLASKDSPIFIAGSFNGWNPGDEKFILEGRSDLKWQITMPPSKSGAKVEFKFTRGAWDLEQLNEDLSVPGNNMLPKVDAGKYPPGGDRPVFEYKVVKWGDQRPNAAARPDLNPYYELKVGAGTLKRLEIPGGGAISGAGKRDALVWLPPGYDAPENAGKSYPVLYVFDGQNLFQQMPGTPAEWSLDEHAGALIDQGRIEPLVIVGLPHAGKARTSEYSPIALVDGAEPRGAHTLLWLTGQVMPRVQRAFRVRTGPGSTALAGASLGGVMSLYCATERPDVFGTAVALSTPWAIKDGVLLKHFAGVRTWPERVYVSTTQFEAGTDPSSAPLNKKYTDAYDAFVKLVEDARSKTSVQVPRVFSHAAPRAGMTHNEEAWAQESMMFLDEVYGKKK